ncbi:MAG: hypothetical protein ACPGJV_06355 [Bacteriovoracaceae bacterium]
MRYTNKSFEDFSLAQVCKEMKASSKLIIEAHGVLSVDCMGQLIKVSDFCMKKFKRRKNFVRGYIGFDRLENPRAYCQFAEQSIVSFNCSKSPKFCLKDSRRTCQKLGRVYARRLEPLKSFQSNLIGGRTLSCYFQEPSEEDKLFSELN